jgi:hypothetical protein
VKAAYLKSEDHGLTLRATRELRASSARVPHEVAHVVGGTFDGELYLARGNIDKATAPQGVKQRRRLTQHDVHDKRKCDLYNLLQWL